MIHAVALAPPDLEAVRAQATRAWVVAPGRLPAAPPGVLGAAALHDGIRAALREGAEQVWLLGPRVRPAPDALERLLAVDAGDAPLLAGRVRGAAEPLPRVLDKPAAIAAAARGLVALRAAPAGSLLVPRATFERHGLPTRGVLAWTTRVLADRAGLLVPASGAEQVGVPARERLPWPALSREERLWLAFRRAGRAGRSRPRPRPAGTARS